MKRYKFSLQSALRARRAQEDVARQRLAASNHKLLLAKNNFEESLLGYRALNVALGETTLEVFVGDRAREGRSAETVERARQMVQDAKVDAAMCFSAWVDSAKQVRSLDRLDEKRREEWRLEDLKDEAAAIDDVVTARWAVAGQSHPRGLLR